MSLVKLPLPQSKAAESLLDLSLRAIGRSKAASKMIKRLVTPSVEGPAPSEVEFAALLAESLRPLASPEEIKAQASQLLGEHLAADRVLYFEVIGDDVVVERDYTRGVPGLAGRYSLATFGLATSESFRSGQTVIHPDLWTNPSLTSTDRRAFDAIQVRAYVGVPLLKGGIFVGGFAIHQSQPRAWTSADVALVEDIAERTWEAVERARTTRQIDASERLRRMALDAAEIGVWSLNPADSSITQDERSRMIFHGSPDPSSYERDFGAIHPEDQPRVAAAVAAALRPDAPAPYAEEFRIVRPDGIVRWVSATGRAHVVNGPMGRQVESFDGTVRDITENKQAQEHLMKAADERERLLAELQEQDRRKDEFLAMLGHELRNPLAPISNALHLLRLQGAEAPWQQQARAVIERQVGQLRRLVDDLLEVSRISTGRIQLRQERISVAGLVNRAIETTRPLIESRRHTVAVTMPPEPIMLEADASRLEQVLVNLLTNSAKYSGEGASIDLIAAQEGQEAVLRVRDTGDGIAPELLPRVFDLFTQAKRSLARSEGGLGIGLALVKRLVELHGGRVDATSTLGKGSEFVVRLPCAGVEEHAHVASQAIPPEAASGARVLVVEDNIDSAETLADLLRISGHEVRTNHDGPAGLAAAIKWRPDVVLLDIGLPQMDGYQVAALIRQNPDLQGLVLVALTGYGQEADHLRSRTAGFDHHLVKPADFLKILEIVASARR